MAVRNEIALVKSGSRYVGWDDIHIHKSMLNMCSAFGFLAPDFFEENISAWGLKLGDEVSVEIDEKTTCTGYIDSMPVEHHVGRGRTVQIDGRDKTCDLVDSSFVQTANEWKGQTISKLIQNLCDPFDITRVVESSALSGVSIVIDTFKANEGDMVSDLIWRLCREASVLPLSYGDGALTITRASTSKYSSDIVEDIEGSGNVIWSRLEQTNKDRYSDYIVKGFGIGNDNKSLADFTHPIGEFSDGVISRHRPLVMFSDSPTDKGKCQERARWEARLRAGLSRARIYTVKDWAQTTGELWEMNTLVQVIDEFSDFDDFMMIAKIDHFLDKKYGALTDLTLVDKNTFTLSANDITIKTGFDND